MNLCTWKSLEVVLTVFLTTLWGVSSNSTQPVNDSAVISSSQSLELTNFTLRKCHCNSDHVLDESTCKARSTAVVLSDTVNQAHIAVNTSEFDTVAVEELQCSDGLVRLNFSDQDTKFSLLPSGELHWWDNGLSFQEYCIEHYMHNSNTVGWKSQVCLQPPPVPRCCPSGHIMAPDDSCIPHSNDTFAPPIVVGSTFMQLATVHGDVVNITCLGASVARRINLNTHEGSLHVNPQQAILEWYPSTDLVTSQIEYEYCVGIEIRNYAQYYIAKFCHLEPSLHHQIMCKNSTCVRKCCPVGQLVWDQSCVTAESEEETWKPPLKASENESSGLAFAENWMVVDGNPFCKKHFLLEPNLEDEDPFYLLPNGFLYVPLYNSSFPATDYCVDFFLTTDVYSVVHKALLCAPETQHDDCHWNSILNAVLISISCVFLAATLGVYLGVADLRDRTYGRCLVSMVAAMLCMYITIVVNNQERNMSDAVCITRAFVGHVCTLATFFWLNVMCYDMWSTLRSSRQKHHSKKVFMLYSLYAWGCSLVIGVVTVTIDSLDLPNTIRPKFTDGTCWFYGNESYWIYLSGIIFCLVVVNLFFFVHVAFTLAGDFRRRRTTFDTNTSRSSNSTRTMEQVWLYVKLFIVMGIVWIAEIISSIHDRNSCSYWVFADIINGLQGVFIFLVTVCNKDNRKKIRDAWNPRLQSVRKTFTSIQGQTTITKTGTGRRGTDLSVGTSEASRKTSVTSLPRKFSVASSVFFPTSNKAKRTTGLSDTSETSRKSTDNTTSRKISTVSNLETIPMENMNE